MKALLRRLIGALGYDLAPRDRRDSLAGALRNLARLGVRPATVIDVGAAYGDFTRTCRATFPEAAYLLIEPLAEYASALDAVAGEARNVHLIRAAAGSRDGDTAINVHPDLVGSSLYREGEATDVNGTPRTVPSITLETVVRDRGLKGPYFLKIDVQGAEGDVLAGAAGILPETDLVLLELSFFGFFEGAPLAGEMIERMAAQGFVPYDIVGLNHRPLDGALAQADILFARWDGDLRRDHHYATAEQRRALTERLRR